MGACPDPAPTSLTLRSGGSRRRADSNSLRLALHQLGVVTLARRALQSLWSITDSPKSGSGQVVRAGRWLVQRLPGCGPKGVDRLSDGIDHRAKETSGHGVVVPLA